LTPSTLRDNSDFPKEMLFGGSDEQEKARAPKEAIAPAQPAADLDARTAATEVEGFPVELGDVTLIAPDSMRDDQKLAETMLSPLSDADVVEFDVSLTDSVFLGQPMMSPEFDVGSINLDLAAPPVGEATMVATGITPASPAPDAQWEEVNTKLDLAKAYEEMGDLEGSRELLQEVMAEGPPELVEQAKAILARIGE